MSTFLTRLTLLTVAGTFAIAPAALSQSAAPQGTTMTAQTAQLSPAKRALIDKLLVLTDADKNAQTIVDMMLKEQERQTPAAVEQTLSMAKNLSPESMAEVRKKLTAEREAYLERFRVLFKQEVNIGQYLNDVFYKLYDKYFTEQELKDLVAFYESPTGKKSTAVMPQLTQESMQMTSAVLMTKILEIEQRVQAERKAAHAAASNETKKPASSGSGASAEAESAAPKSK